MTEQPPPPNQPPAPPGYGHLPAPPPAAPGPPQGPNPYALPFPDPAPDPVRDLRQPGHGFPPLPLVPPLPPAPAVTAPGGRPGGRRPALIAAATAAALLAAATGAHALLADADAAARPPQARSTPPATPTPSGPDDGPDDGNGGAAPAENLDSGRTPGEDRALWSRTSRIDGPGAGVGARGQWIVGDTLVKAVHTTLTGYATADGTQKWTLSLPTAICAVTDRTTPDGKTVVLHRESGSETAGCNQLRMIDLKAGRAGWSEEVPREGVFDLFTTAGLTLTADTVAVNRLGAASAFKVSTGEKLFTSLRPEGCRPDTYAAGQGRMIAVATCQDPDRTVEIQDTDPLTGRTTWSHRLPKGFTVTQVHSLDPLVLDLTDKADRKRAVVVLGPDGTQRATLTADGDFTVGCTDTLDPSLQDCTAAATDATTLYLPTVTRPGTANEIVALDLTTGRTRWRAPAGDGRTLTPLKTADGRLLAHREAADGQGGELLAFPAAGGPPTTLLRLPSGPAALAEAALTRPEADYADGRLFLSTTRLRARGEDERLLMAFGK
ncbi:PQQ-binding-like beta-propeller repeat protein [Streptomyces sp. NPDC051567]|uniref:outer membrane protein assembly factor BamB family protein n=1 Tax=Streptomyces sp. NPDC051567 TaxID=3365660 RepID=UPI0037AA1960